LEGLRAKNANKTVLGNWFQSWSNLLQQYSDITPDRIFNMDETGCTLDGKVGKIFTGVGKQKRTQKISGLCQLHFSLIGQY